MLATSGVATITFLAGVDLAVATTCAVCVHVYIGQNVSLHVYIRLLPLLGFLPYLLQALP